MNEQFSKTIYGFSEGNCPEICPELAGQSVGKDRQPDSLIRSYCTVFSWPLLSTDINNRGRLYINLDLEIFVLTFLVLSHHWNISDSNTPKVKPRSRVKYLPEVKVKFCNSGYPVNGDFSTCRAVKDFLCLRVSFLVLNFSSRSVVQISW